MRFPWLSRAPFGAERSEARSKNKKASWNGPSMADNPGRLCPKFLERRIRNPSVSIHLSIDGDEFKGGGWRSQIYLVNKAHKNSLCKDSGDKSRPVGNPPRRAAL